MRNTFVSGLEKLAENDDRLFLMTGDLGFGVLDGFAQKFPERFINAGISEQNMAAVAAGIALEGNIVYTYSIGNFPTMRCLEQIRNDICYHNANVKIVSVGAGLSYGQLGMSHHATEDIAIMRALPNMKVFSPADPQEATSILKEVHHLSGPAYIRLGKGREQNNHADMPVDNVYAAQKIKDGSDGCIFTTGAILSEVIKAVNELEKKGILIGVYSILTIKPIDKLTIQHCGKQYKWIFTVEEHNVIGGLGSAVAEVLAEMPDNCACLSRIGMLDQYSSIVGSHDYLRDYYGLSAQKIVDKIMRAMRIKI